MSGCIRRLLWHFQLLILCANLQRDRLQHLLDRDLCVLGCGWLLRLHRNLCLQLCGERARHDGLHLASRDRSWHVLHVDELDRLGRRHVAKTSDAKEPRGQRNWSRVLRQNGYASFLKFGFVFVLVLRGLVCSAWLGQVCLGLVCSAWLGQVCSMVCPFRSVLWRAPCLSCFWCGGLHALIVVLWFWDVFPSACSS